MQNLMRGAGRVVPSTSFVDLVDDISSWQMVVKSSSTVLETVWRYIQAWMRFDPSLSLSNPVIGNFDIWF